MSKAPLDFLSTSGEVGAMMRAHDWAASPLGHPDTWPQPLLTVTSLILNSKFPMVVAWGPELGFLYNDAYAEILADKHPAALGRRFADVWSEIWSDVSPIVDQAMAGKASYFENLPLVMHRKGYVEQTWFTFSYSPVHDEDGKVGGMYCACTETTQQVLAERHRLAENERLRSLFQQAPGTMAVVRGPDHVFELVNDAYLQLVGKRELVGKPIREALPELAGQGYFERIDRVYTTGETYVGHALRANLRRGPGNDLEERFLDLVFQPIKDHSEKVTGIFFEGSDVTDAVRTTNALRESEQRLRQLANTIPHLAWMANPDGWVHWFNDRWYEYSGTRIEEMQGWGWQSVHDPETLPGVIKKYKVSLASGHPFEMTFPLRAANGQFRTFYTLAAPLRDATGEIVQWFGTNTDVTEIQKAQEELKTANSRKDEFLAMLAHELRNPLAPISAATELLQVVNLDGERVRESSEIIARQVGHMTSLVDDLLDVSRVTRGLVDLEKTTLDITEVVTDAVEQVTPLIRSRRHHLQLHLTPAATMVLGDKKRLVQIVANLVNNAAKYTPEGGNILLRTEGHETHVLLEVVDDGIGMAEELTARVFDLFVQAERSSDRSSGGLGLGLALVKSLVELHGGTVSCASDGIGKGSRFAIHLPRLLGPVARPGRRRTGERLADPARPLRILVVDDNVDAAVTLAMLLEVSGHDVLVEHGSIRALERARIEVPDVCLLDIGLPDMDGNELAKRLRAQPETRQCVLIATTGYGQESDRNQALAAGFHHHLVKPIDTRKLASMLSEISAA